MGLSKERKIFVGVLGTAVAALVIDQGFLQPGAADGGVVLPPPGGAPAAAPEPTPAGPLAKAASLARIAERLRATGLSGDTATDAFALPASWTPDQALAATAQPESAAEVGAQADDLVLTGVMPSSGGGVAVINGVSVPVGSPVAGTGYRLIEVTSGLAVLSDGSETRVLKMPHSRFMIPKPGPRRDGPVAPADRAG